jgi:hypothetical protein
MDSLSRLQISGPCYEEERGEEVETAMAFQKKRR